MGFSGLISEDPATVTSIELTSTQKLVTAEDTELSIQHIQLQGTGTGDVTVTITTEGGTSTFNNAGGAVVVNSGTGELTVTGSLSDINAAFANGLQFTPTENQNSLVDDYAPKITIRSGDTELEISDISVTAVNDAPDFGTKVPLVLGEGESKNLSLEQLASSWEALDADIGTGQQVKEQLVIIIDSLPTSGTLTYNGSPVSVGQVVAATDIGNLQYTASKDDVSSDASASFGITVHDGGGGSRSGQIDIIIQPRNVAPSIGSTSPSLIEGETQVVAPEINLGDSADTIADAVVTIDEIVTGGQGTFFFDLNGDNKIDEGEALVIPSGQTSVTLTAEQKANLGSLKFKHDGTEPNAPDMLAPSYRITVTDSGGGQGSEAQRTTDATVTLRITPNNDDPTLDNAHGSSDNPLELEERAVGGTGPTLLTEEMLSIQDGDINPNNPASTTPKDQLVYTVESAPAEGELQLYVGGNVGHGGDGWITLGAGGRFTQQDIADGKVRYYQTTDVAVDTMDGFSFTVRDSAFGYAMSADGVAGELQEGAVRDENGNVAIQTFHIKIQATEVEHEDYTGGPRPATPGYGGSNTEYEFKPVVVLPGNGNDTENGIWNEDNVGTVNGGYLLSDAMLNYEITRTDNAGTPGDTSDDVVLKVPASETVYTLTVQPGNGTLERLVDGEWETISTNGQFTQKDINDGRIRFVSNGSENHTAEFGFTVSDGSSMTPHEGVFAIDITPTNDRPTVSGGNASVTEGEGNTVRLDSDVLGMADADESEDPSKHTGEGAPDHLWFKLETLPEHGKLERWNGAAWVDAVIGEWLPQELLTATADGQTSGLRYVHDGSEPLAYADGKPQVSFTYSVRDDLGQPGNAFVTDHSVPPDATDTNQSNVSSIATAVINVTPVNGAPQIQVTPNDTAPSVTGTITGGGATAAVNAILLVNEGDTGNIEGLLVAIDSDNTTVQRQYQLTAVPGQGTLMLGGKALGIGSTFTQADIDSGRLTYVHSGDEPDSLTNGNYNDLFKFKVSDGAATSVEGTFWINVQPLNDAPTIAPTTPGDEDKLWIIDSSNHWVDMPHVTIGDPDLVNGIQDGETDYIKVTVALKDGDNPLAEGKLQSAYPVSGDLTITGSGTPTLVLEGTLEEVQKALDQLQAQTSGVDLDRSDLSLVITVDDRISDTEANGGGEKNADGSDFSDANNTASVTFKIAASDKNDVPEITPPTNGTEVGGTTEYFTVIEDSLASLGGLSISDPDDFGVGDNYTVTVSVEHGSFNGGSQKTITLTGQTLEQVNAFLSALQYRADSNFNGKDTLTITVNDHGNHGQDGTEGSADLDVTKTFAIYIRPQNDAPVVTLPHAGEDIPLTSGEYEFSSSNGNAIVVSDIDTLDAANSDKPGHQITPDNSDFSVTLEAKYDGEPIGEFSFLGGDTYGVDIADDLTGGVTLTGTLSAINQLLADGVVYQLADSEANVDGKIVFTVTANDAANGGSGLYDTDLGSAGDRGALTNAQTLTFMVTDANAEPGFGSFPSSDPTYVQNGPALTLTPSGDLNDPELDMFNNWSGSTLTISHADSEIAGGIFGFASGVTVSGNNLNVGGTTVGSFTHTNGTLTIAFSTDADSAAADTVLRNITYKNDSADAPREITLSYEIKDGNSNTGGASPGPDGNGQDQGTGGELVGTASLTIVIDRPITITVPTDTTGESGNINDHVVYESGLAAGSAPEADDLKVDSSFTITAPDGVDNITIQYKDAQGVNQTQTISSSALEALGSSDVTITTQYGELKLNGYDLSDGVITVEYEYLLTKAPAVSGTDTNDTFTITAKDIDSSAISSKSLDLNIKIVDDAPLAADDTNSIEEDATAPVMGNVIVGGTGDAGQDTLGADGATVSGVAVGDKAAHGDTDVAGQVSIDVDGQYGTLVLDADGSYSYALDNTNLDVQGLTSGESLTETYTYTI
ncbi:cadherin-like domain-containing protein, partial [Pantoea sp. 18069]|uniref:cadherin-like domain-containing protein n=1 Tax=Pantoea sp. 18069 TaxID=2681415 RepID=UPI00135B6F2A